MQLVLDYVENLAHISVTLRPNEHLQTIYELPRTLTLKGLEN